jgi:hypothetical protein
LLYISLVVFVVFRAFPHLQSPAARPGAAPLHTEIGDFLYTIGTLPFLNANGTACGVTSNRCLILPSWWSLSNRIAVFPDMNSTRATRAYIVWPVYRVFKLANPRAH